MCVGEREREREEEWEGGREGGRLYIRPEEAGVHTAGLLHLPTSPSGYFPNKGEFDISEHLPTPLHFLKRVIYDNTLHLLCIRGGESSSLSLIALT